MVTKAAGTNYSTPVVPVRFYAFLQEIFKGDQELIDYTQKVLGYALVDEVREQHVWLSQGNGGNGKTMLFERTAEAMGDYATVGDTSIIVDQKFQSKSFDLANMVGARRVTFSELKPGQKLNEDRIKRLSGDGKETAEAKFKQPFKFNPRFKMFIDTNSLPNVEEVTDAIWRRLRIIPFTQCFIKDSPGCLEPDTNLKAVLVEELPGILRWLVEGALKWQREGLDEPNSVKMPTQAYRDDQDDMAEFIRECIVKDDNAQVSVSDLHKAYQSWFQGERWEMLEKVPFGKNLTSHGFRSRKSHGRMVYLGIRLATVEDFPTDPDPDADID